MKYKVRDQKGMVLGQDLEVSQVEALLVRQPQNAGLTFGFGVSAKLAVDISAYVIREPGKNELIEIKSGNVEIVVKRDRRPKDAFSVSCSPDGKMVPVRSFNLKFRKQRDDNLTDRGLVWVIPGSPASFHLTVTGLASKYGITNILNAAEQAVQNQLLSLLQTPESVIQ